MNYENSNEISEDRTRQMSKFKFSDVFWGEKLSGYSVLYQNLRNTQQSVKELETFLRESAAGEDTYVKQLNKVTSQMQKFLLDSSLSPLWNEAVKDLNERNSWSHLHYMHRLHELIKMVQSYGEDIRKRKQKIKETESKTEQLIEHFKTLKLHLNKSREQYYQAHYDLNKQGQLVQQEQQSNSGIQTNSSSIMTQFTKLEKKFQTSLEVYKLNIEKYNKVRVEYERQFTESCNVFQIQEESHLSQMRDFLFNYVKIVGQLNISRKNNQEDFEEKLRDVYTSETLLQKLIMTKATGRDKPELAEFIEWSPTVHLIHEANKLSNNRLLSQSKYDFTEFNQSKDYILNSSASLNMSNLNESDSVSQTLDRKKNESKSSGFFNLDFIKNKGKKAFDFGGSLSRRSVKSEVKSVTNISTFASPSSNQGHTIYTLANDPKGDNKIYQLGNHLYKIKIFKILNTKTSGHQEKYDQQKDYQRLSDLLLAIKIILQFFLSKVN